MIRDVIRRYGQIMGFVLVVVAFSTVTWMAHRTDAHQHALDVELKHEVVARLSQDCVRSQRVWDAAVLVSIPVRISSTAHPVTRTPTIHTTIIYTPNVAHLDAHDLTVANAALGARNKAHLEQRAALGPRPSC